MEPADPPPSDPDPASSGAAVLLAATAEPPPTPARLREVAAGLAGALAGARTAWSAVTLGEERFVQHLAGHLAGASDCLLALERLQTDDLYLACACLHGDAEALRAFDRQFLGEISAAVRRLDPSPAFADEVRQQLAQRLLLGQEDERP